MRSKDRLNELLRKAAVESPTQAYPNCLDSSAPSEVDKKLSALLQEVEVTRCWISEINNNTLLIRRLQADPTFHTNTYLQGQLDAAVTRSNALGLKASGALRQLAERAAGAGAASDTCARAVRVAQAASARLLSAALTDHHHALSAARDHHRALLQHTLRITNVSISDEECEALLDSNNVSIFVGNVQAQTAEAQRALREAEARHAELTRVEAALADLNQLFQHLAYLVASQQDQIDSVEYYALQATEHVECGGQQLLKGTINRNKARKKKWGLIICLVSGFLIIFLVLIYT